MSTRINFFHRFKFEIFITDFRSYTRLKNIFHKTKIKSNVFFCLNRYRRGPETCPQAKKSKRGHAIFFSFFRRVRATSLTQRRVENTRVQFSTFSPVSVKNLKKNFSYCEKITEEVKIIISFKLIPSNTVPTIWFVILNFESPISIIRQFVQNTIQPFCGTFDITPEFTMWILKNEDILGTQLCHVYLVQFFIEISARHCSRDSKHPKKFIDIVLSPAGHTTKCD